LNEINFGLQGRNITYLDGYEKINSLKQKLQLWKRRAGRGNYANFPNLDSFIEGVELGEGKIRVIDDHLATLITAFDGYFSDFNDPCPWLRDPFAFNLENMDDDDILKESLIDLRTKAQLRDDHATMPLDRFWCIKLLKDIRTWLGKR
jgi:hypothetical protein